MANKNTKKILISLILGISVACVTLNRFSNMEKEIKSQNQLIKVMKQRDIELDAKKAQYKYLTAARNIEAGETITEADITTATFAEEQPDGLDSPEMVIGNVLLEPVKSGQVLTGYVFTGVVSNKSLSPQGLKEGYRALTLNTGSLDGLSSDMKIGSLIDVFSKNKSNSFVLSKVKILSLEPTTPTNTEDDKKISILSAKTATFEVPVDKIQEFVEMYSAGKILLVMRPIGDDTVIVGRKKQTDVAHTNNYRNVNYNYDSAMLPPMPAVQTYEEPTINELPAPVKAQKTTQRTVEIIEANNKTQINFD